jgi:hypothetical protein
MRIEIERNGAAMVAAAHFSGEPEASPVSFFSLFLYDFLLGLRG